MRRLQKQVQKYSYGYGRPNTVNKTTSVVGSQASFVIILVELYWRLSLVQTLYMVMIPIYVENEDCKAMSGKCFNSGAALCFASLRAGDGVPLRWKASR